MEYFGGVGTDQTVMSRINEIISELFCYLFKIILEGMHVKETQNKCQMLGVVVGVFLLLPLL